MSKCDGSVMTEGAKREQQLTQYRAMRDNLEAERDVEAAVVQALREAAHGPLCQATLEWRCSCHFISGHEGNHECGCGFTWEQDNPLSTMGPNP